MAKPCQSQPSQPLPLPPLMIPFFRFLTKVGMGGVRCPKVGWVGLAGFHTKVGKSHKNLSRGKDNRLGIGCQESRKQFKPNRTMNKHIMSKLERALAAERKKSDSVSKKYQEKILDDLRTHYPTIAEIIEDEKLRTTGLDAYTLFITSDIFYRTVGRKFYNPNSLDGRALSTLEVLELLNRFVTSMNGPAYLDKLNRPKSGRK